MDTAPHPVLARSTDLFGEILSAFNQRFDDGSREGICQAFCALSLAHARAVRELAALDLVVPAVAVLRCQFEAVVRGVWTLYAATDAQIEKLTVDLSPESEQRAKGLPMVNEMLTALEKCRAAYGAYHAFAEFREYSWPALNSHVHAGIHPLKRFSSGYPTKLVVQFIEGSNGLAVMAGIQVAMISGQRDLVMRLRRLGERFPDCLQPKNAEGARSTR